MSEFGEKARKFVDNAAKETIRLGDTAAMTIKLKRCESRIDVRLRELGLLTYRRLRYDEDNTGKMDGILAEIDGLYIERDNLRREIDHIKMSGNKD